MYSIGRARRWFGLCGVLVAVVLVAGPLMVLTGRSSAATAEFTITGYADQRETVTHENTHMAYSPVHDRIFVQSGRSSLSVLNPRTLEIENTTGIGSSLGNGYPGQLVADPIRGWLYQNRTSSAWPRILVPGSDNVPAVHTPDLGEVLRGQRRLAIESASGAVFLAVDSGEPIIRLQPIGDDPSSPTSFQVTRFANTLKIDDIAMLSPTTAIVGLKEPVDGSLFALATFHDTGVSSVPVPFSADITSARNSRTRVAALDSNCFYVALSAQVQKFCMSDGAAQADGQVVTLPFQFDNVVADRRTQTLFVADNSHNAIRVHAIRGDSLVATDEYPLPGAAASYLALDGTGGVVAGNAGTFVRFGPGESASLPEPNTDTVVLDEGHLDVAPIIVNGGQLVPYIKDGSRPVQLARWIRIDQTVWHVKPVPEARQTITEGSVLEQYFGPAGTTFWQLPASQLPGLLWPGWSGEQIANDASDGLSVTMTGYTGPGAFVLTDPEGTINLNSADLSLTRPIILGSHGHSYWNFSAEGVYRLTLTFTATTISGESLSAAATLAIAVGAVDPTTVTPGAGMPSSSPSVGPTEEPSATVSPSHSPSPSVSPSASHSPSPSISTSSTPDVSTSPSTGSVPSIAPSHVDSSAAPVGGSLPVTGASMLSMIAVAAGVFGAGVLLLFAARRRRTSSR